MLATQEPPYQPLLPHKQKVKTSALVRVCEHSKIPASRFGNGFYPQFPGYGRGMRQKICGIFAGIRDSAGNAKTKESQ